MALGPPSPLRRPPRAGLQDWPGGTHHPVCPRCPWELPVDLATWSLSPGDLQARVLLNVPAPRLTWSDPRPRDRAARTRQQGPAWLAPFVRNTSLSRPSQARPLATPVQLRHLHRHPPFMAPLCLASPRPCWTSSGHGKASGRRTVLSCRRAHHHRPFSLRPKDLPHPGKSSSLPGALRKKGA